MCCVRVWGLEVDEAKAFCGLSALLVGGVFGKRVCVLVCFVCMACCWVSRTARLLFYRSPLNKQDLLLVVAYVFLGCIWCGCCVWGGVLCENCIVDANAIKKQQFIVVVCFSFFVVLFLVFFVVCA